jgi:hypothetical protein
VVARHLRTQPRLFRGVEQKWRSWRRTSRPVSATRKMAVSRRGVAEGWRSPRRRPVSRMPADESDEIRLSRNLDVLCKSHNCGFGPQTAVWPERSHLVSPPLNLNAIVRRFHSVLAAIRGLGGSGWRLPRSSLVRFPQIFVSSQQISTPVQEFCDSHKCVVHSRSLSAAARNLENRPRLRSLLCASCPEVGAHPAPRPPGQIARRGGGSQAARPPAGHNGPLAPCVSQPRRPWLTTTDALPDRRGAPAPLRPTKRDLTPGREKPSLQLPRPPGCTDRLRPPE